MSKYQISLSKPKKPILQIQQYPMFDYQMGTNGKERQNKEGKRKTNKGTLLILSTIDKYVYFLQLQSTQYNQMGSLLLSSTCTSIFYDMYTGIVLLGCLNGDISKYILHSQNTTQSKIHNHYQPTSTQNCQVVSLYTRKNTIYCWNLNYQVLLIDLETMHRRCTINIFAEIAASCVLRVRKQGCYMPAVCFANCLPPFVFDCDKQGEIVETFKWMKEYYNKGMYYFEEQIYLIADQKQQYVAHSSKYDYIATASQRISKVRKQGKESGTFIVDQSTKYYICLYKLQKQEKFSLCQLILRFQSGTRLAFLNVNQQHIMTCMEKEILIYDIEKRGVICKISNPNIQWGFLLYSHPEEKDNDTKQIYKILLSRGFNYWNLAGSKLNRTKLHFKQIKKSSPVMDVTQ